MNESRLEALLTQKGKLWFGIAWVLVLTAVTVLPGVDTSTEEYHELGKLRAELASRAALPDRARRLADRVAKVQEDMADLEATLVPADAVSTYRQGITQMARRARCRVRSVRPGPAGRRSLDEVLGKSGSKAKRGAKKKPKWEVDEQTSVFSVQGTFANLIDFLSRLDNDVRLLELASLDLHSTSDRSKELILDLQIKTFDLIRNRPG